MLTKNMVVGLVLFFATAALAQNELPRVVENGFAAYQESGSQKAIESWFKGSPLENEAAARVKMINVLSEIETAYGKMSGYETIRNVSVAPSYQRVYMLIKYQKGPLFAVFDCYKTEAGWIVTHLNFNAEAELILPAEVLAGHS